MAKISCLLVYGFLMLPDISTGREATPAEPVVASTVSPAEVPQRSRAGDGMVPLSGEWRGMYGMSSGSKTASAGKPRGGTARVGPNESIPLFEFGIFYNGLLEFTACGAFSVDGCVYANGDIYVGSGNPLTFRDQVRCSGLITNPPWAGIANTNNYRGVVKFQGRPLPGYKEGEPVLALPVGGAGNSPSNLIQIIYPPPAAEALGSPLSRQRYYNKAGMVVMVSNNVEGDITVTFELRSPDAFGDKAPVRMTFTNLLYIGAGPYEWTNAEAGAVHSNFVSFTNWLSVSNEPAFFDARERKWMKTVEIDIAAFNSWSSNASYEAGGFIYPQGEGAGGKFNSNAPLNIIYVADWRETNSGTNVAVRLRNGGTLNFPRGGLTVATPNPLYVWGNYDTPETVNFMTKNVSGTFPTSFICDALTILSTNWVDANSSEPLSARKASSTTVNGAMITGIVYSTGPGGKGTGDYSGGAQNMPRLLEDWNTAVLTLNTSLVNLYPSASATHFFEWPGAEGNVYGVPRVRNFHLNRNYLTAAGLPPGTPLLPVLDRPDRAVIGR